MLLRRLAVVLRHHTIRTGRNAFVEPSILSSPKPYPFAGLSQWQRYLCNDVNAQTTQSLDPATTVTEDEDKKPIRSAPLTLLKQDTSAYMSEIRMHLHANKLKKAIAVVENDMVKRDRVQPDENMFALLMEECGRMGFAKKCFQLFKLMDACQIEPTPDTYTALLKACMATPFLNDGNRYANRVWTVMMDRKYQPTHDQYQLQIEALARTGDLKMALELINKANELNIELDINVYKMLLHMASENTERGFRDALVIWHVMYANQCVPDIYAYHLLLKCVENCGFGIETEAKNIFEKIIRKSKTREQSAAETPAEEVQVTEVDSTEENVIESDAELDHRPNMLSRTPRMGRMLPLRKVVKPADRMLLLGGMSYFIQELTNSGAVPTSGTSLQLLSVIPATNAADERLLLFMRKAKIQPDIIFFNSMLKKRCLNSSYNEALEIVDMMTKYDLKPDMESFVLLAITCKSMEEMQDLLEAIRTHDYIPNIYVYESFVRNSCQQSAFDDIEELLRIVQSSTIKISSTFVSIVDQFCIDFPKNNLIGAHPPKYIVITYEQFSRRYRRWKREVLETPPIFKEKPDFGIDKLDKIAVPKTQRTDNEFAPVISEEKPDFGIDKLDKIAGQKTQRTDDEFLRKKYAPAKKIAVGDHPWEKFNKNVIPDGVDVTPGRAKVKELWGKRRPRSKVWGAEDEQNSDKTKAKPRQNKEYLRRQPMPPRMSADNFSDKRNMKNKSE